MNPEAVSLKLFRTLEKKHPEYIEALNSGEYSWADIEPEFMGFVTYYAALASVISTARTIYDFGCAYAPQAWYFRNHAKYVGINPGKHAVLELPNTEYHWMSGQEFLKTFEPHEDSFAIINYVPDFALATLVKSSFRDCFSFYVAGADLKLSP
jgi:hypothetical protein